MQPTITKIKIKAGEVRAHIPFDVLYLIHKDFQHLLSQVFPYALCFPVSDDIAQRLAAIPVDETEHIAHEKCGPKRDSTTRVTEQYLGAPLREHFALIPILPCVPATVRAKGCRDKFPAYLVADSYRVGVDQRKPRTHKGVCSVVRKDKDAALAAFFNDFAVLFTPTGHVRPICVQCPRHLEHVQGKCSLGDLVCYESLVIQGEEGGGASREQLQGD